jgi:hypothetical protein
MSGEQSQNKELSERERDVFHQLLLGKSNKQIALALSISRKQKSACNLKQNMFRQKNFVIVIVSIGVIFITESCFSISPTRLKTQTPTSTSISATENSPLSIEGVVQEINPNEVTILSPENKTIRLRFKADSRIWDGIDWIAEIPIEIGDHAIAAGSWEENNLVFVVQNLYINIVFLRGIAGEVDKENFRFKLSDLRQGNNTVNVYPLTVIYLSDSNQQGTFQDIKILPTTGEYIEVIGRELSDGTIAAVNITLP